MNEEDREKEADLIVEKLKNAGKKHIWWNSNLYVNIYITPVNPIEYIYVNLSINEKEVTITDDQGPGSGPDYREAEEN